VDLGSLNFVCTSYGLFNIVLYGLTRQLRRSSDDCKKPYYYRTTS
jgi:hypothetical protein